MENHPQPEDLTVDSRLVLCERSMSSEIDGERVILALDSGVYYGVNEVGAYIWELLESPQTVGELRTQVATEFDTTPQECGRDVREFCADLIKLGLADIHDDE